MARLIMLLVLCAAAAGAQPRQPHAYVLLWFDTEDYIEPKSDDAALRIATDLEKAGVQGTFKIVGEKARVLEQRGRRDVIAALGRHAIGYHSEFHSVQPVPSVYLRTMGYLEGASEFSRREGRGVADVRRIFGRGPVCYGQPGSSWGPQSNLALRRLGISAYIDEGSQVGLRNQPFWYGGLLYVFQMGPNLIRPDLNRPERNAAIFARFDAAVNELAAHGGGVISTYYHPTEFVTTEFWDGVNFSHGEVRDRSAWQGPHRRTAADSEHAYSVLRDYVAHGKADPRVRFITADDLLRLYADRMPALDPARAAGHLARGITFLETAEGTWSASELLQIALGMKPGFIEGPVARGRSTYAAAEIPRWLFEHMKADVVEFIDKEGRLPDAVFAGPETVSLADFAATVAGAASLSATAATVPVRRGSLDFEQYFSNDAVGAFNWLVHPHGFAAPELLELGRLQGWTLKPARLVKGE
jgi:hypothetical protein